jgi:predicted DsbA family dithiol-disulfide isomerase
LAQIADELGLEQSVAADSAQSEGCHEKLKSELSVGVGSAVIEEAQLHFGE